MDTQNPLPDVLTQNADITHALNDIVTTERGGQNLTEEQYQALADAVSAVLHAHPDLTAITCLAPCHLNLLDWSDRDLATWIVAGELLVTTRGEVPAPAGVHGPWPWTRCVYCSSNDLDVQLYTVDPIPCPPVWVCGDDSYPHRPAEQRNGPEAFAYCQLTPNHDGDHEYQWSDPDNCDQARVLRWS